jgi:hypothetical protein
MGVVHSSPCTVMFVGWTCTPCRFLFSNCGRLLTLLIPHYCAWLEIQLLQASEIVVTTCTADCVYVYVFVTILFTPSSESGIRIWPLQIIWPYKVTKICFNPYTRDNLFLKEFVLLLHSTFRDQGQKSNFFTEEMRHSHDLVTSLLRITSSLHSWRK